MGTEIACVQLKNNLFMRGRIDSSVMQVHKIRGISVDLVHIMSKSMFEEFDAYQFSKKLFLRECMINRMWKMGMNLGKGMNLAKIAQMFLASIDGVARP